MRCDMADITREDLIEALLHHNATARRLPRHHVDKLAAIHERLNELLDQLDMLASLDGLEVVSDG